MENFNFTETPDYDYSPVKGFSKAQLLKFSVKDIEDLLLKEYPEASGEGKENPNKSSPDRKKSNEGGPRPPKEEEFPDKEKEELFSEVSDPNEKD